MATTAAASALTGSMSLAHLRQLSRADLEARVSACEAQLARAQAAAEREQARTTALLDENGRLNVLNKELNARLHASTASQAQELTALQRSLLDRGTAAASLSAENQKLHEVYKATLARCDALQEQVDSLGALLRRKDALLRTQETQSGSAQRHADEVSQLVVDLHTELERERAAHAATTAALDAARERETVLNEHINATVASASEAAQRAREAIGEAHALRARTDELTTTAQEAQAQLSEVRAELAALRDSHDCTARMYEAELLEANRKLQHRELGDAMRKQISSAVHTLTHPLSPSGLASSSIDSKTVVQNARALLSSSALQRASSLVLSAATTSTTTHRYEASGIQSARSQSVTQAAVAVSSAGSVMKPAEPARMTAEELAASLRPSAGASHADSSAVDEESRAALAHALASRDVAVEAAARAQLELEALRGELQQVRAEQNTAAAASRVDQQNAELARRLEHLEAAVHAAQHSSAQHEALAQRALSQAEELAKQLNESQSDRHAVLDKLQAVEQTLQTVSVASSAQRPNELTSGAPAATISAVQNVPVRAGPAASLLRAATAPVLPRQPQKASPPVVSSEPLDLSKRAYEAEIALLRRQLEALQSQVHDSSAITTQHDDAVEERGDAAAFAAAQDLGAAFEQRGPDAGHDMDAHPGEQEAADEAGLREFEEQVVPSRVPSKATIHASFRAAPSASFRAPAATRSEDDIVSNSAHITDATAGMALRSQSASAATLLPRVQPDQVVTRSTNAASTASMISRAGSAAVMLQRASFRAPSAVVQQQHTSDTQPQQELPYALEAELASAPDEASRPSPQAGTTSTQPATAALEADVVELQRQLTEAKFQLMRSKTSKRLLKMEVDGMKTEAARSTSRNRTSTPGKIRAVRSEAALTAPLQKVPAKPRDTPATSSSASSATGSVARGGAPVRRSATAAPATFPVVAAPAAPAASTVPARSRLVHVPTAGTVGVSAQPATPFPTQSVSALASPKPRPLMRAALSHITEDGDARDEGADSWQQDPGYEGVDAADEEDGARVREVGSAASGSSGTTAVLLENIPSTMDVLKAGPSAYSVPGSSRAVDDVHEHDAPGADAGFDFANVSLDDLAAMVDADMRQHEEQQQQLAAARASSLASDARRSQSMRQAPITQRAQTARGLEASADTHRRTLVTAQSVPVMNTSVSSTGTIERLQREVDRARRTFQSREV